MFKRIFDNSVAWQLALKGLNDGILRKCCIESELLCNWWSVGQSVSQSCHWAALELM